MSFLVLGTALCPTTSQNCTGPYGGEWLEVSKCRPQLGCLWLSNDLELEAWLTLFRYFFSTKSKVLTLEGTSIIKIAKFGDLRKLCDIQDFSVKKFLKIRLLDGS